MNATVDASGTLIFKPSRQRLAVDVWTVLAVAIGAFVAVPIGFVFFTALGSSDGIWDHLVSTVLAEYVGNTLWLTLGVGVGTIVIGTSTAWLVTMYRFPGRRVLSWAVLLPLAVPSYVLAFVITDQLEYAGTVQSVLRGLFGWNVAARLLVPGDPFARRRDHRVVTRALSLCIPPRAGRLY